MKKGKNFLAKFTALVTFFPLRARLLLSLPFFLDVGQLVQFIDLLALVKISQYIKTTLPDRLNVFVVWFISHFFLLRLSTSFHSEVSLLLRIGVSMGEF